MTMRARIGDALLRVVGTFIVLIIGGAGVGGSADNTPPPPPPRDRG